MKWTNDELNLAITMIDTGNSYIYVANKLDRSLKSVKNKLNKNGVYVKKTDPYCEYVCQTCNKTFNGKIKEKRKFCSNSCSASFNNGVFIKRKKKENDNCTCLNCDKIINGVNTKYCNHSCQQEYNKKLVFDKIKNGDISQSNRYYKKYLIHVFGEKCMVCGWSEVNPHSKTIPIELEHIDGNSENNNLENLILLCPNHHSLTKTYKGANRGNGRYSRRIRYSENKSY
jgi:hypothetical protein